MADEPRDWRRGEPPAQPQEPSRGPLPPTEAYRSSLPPRQPGAPVLPPARPAADAASAGSCPGSRSTTSVAILGVSGAGLRRSSTTTTATSTGCPASSAAATARPAAAPRNAENFLLVGSDSRGDLAAGEGVQGTGDNFVDRASAPTR